MHFDPSQIVWALLIGHAVADYPLQGDFLAKAKNHLRPIPGIEPVIALKMHAFIHAGMVGIITGSFFLSLIESLLHTAIDYLKCDERITFTTDQILHVACKLAYAVWIWNKLPI